MCEIPAGKIKAMTLENKPVSKLIEPQYLDLFLYELLTIYLLNVKESIHFTMIVLYYQPNLRKL